MLDFNYKHYWIILIITLVFCSKPQAQTDTRHFVHFTTSDGLSNTWISDIHQCNNGFIWLATQYGLNRYDGTSFESYVYNPDNPTSLNNNWVHTIAEDANNNLWLGTYGKSLHKYDPTMESFTRYHGQPDSVCYLHGIQTLLIDQNDNKWVGKFSDNQLIVYDNKNNEACLMTHTLDSRIIDCVQTQNWIIGITASTIYVFSPDSHQIASTLHLPGNISAVFTLKEEIYYVQDGIIKRIKLDRKGALQKAEKIIQTGMKVNALLVSDNLIYAGGDGGLFTYDQKSQITHRHEHNNLIRNSIIGGEILSLEKDHEGNIWIGSREGLCLMPAYQQQFTIEEYHPSLHKQKRIYSILPTENGVYIGGEGALVFYPNKMTSPPISLITNTQIRTILQSQDGYIYAGGSSKFQNQLRPVIFRIHPSNLKVENRSHLLSKEDKISGITLAILEDKYGGIIATISDKLFYKHKDSTYFKNIQSLIPFDLNSSGLLLHAILDKQDNLWLSIAQSGLLKIKWRELNKPFEKSEINVFQYSEDDPHSISSNLINYIFQSNDGMLWVATDGGLNALAPNQNTFQRYTRSDGLINDKLLAITEDTIGRIWISTISHGLLTLDRSRTIFTNYNTSDGIYHDAFLFRSVGKSSDGILFFGNEGGVQVFRPTDKELDTSLLAHPIFSSLHINNKVITPSNSGILQKAPEYTSDISLKHGQNDILLSYALSSYGKKEQYNYRYQLKGASDNWINIDKLDRISFAHLSPGDYIFRVEACIRQYCNNSNPLFISIRPPWWRSTLAYALYGICLAGVIFGFLFRREQNRIKALQTEKKIDIQKAQSRFFTNMTHELRTPLTLITGPVQRLLLQNKFPDSDSKSLLKSIKANADHILHLVNNLLDISKIDAGMMPVHSRSTELGPFVATIVDSFRPEAINRNINLITDFHTANLPIMVDRDKMRIIISNLMANALKYSEDNQVIHIDVEASSSQISISIADTGQGMTSEESERLFERFYQVDPNQSSGSGIGMSLVQEVITLMKGTVNVDSKKDIGTTVTVKIPIEAMDEIETTSDNVGTNEWSSYNHEDTTHPIILLIEDNAQVATFVKSGLSDNYNVITVRHGKQGCEIAISSLPDVIITDIMMPGMDGYEVCRQIKAHPLTDHIPIVMLTARADEASRIKGMDAGANAFLTKPFNDRELSLLLQNLISTRDSIIKKQLGQNPSAVLERASSRFLKRAHSEIIQLLSQDNLSIPMLCKVLHVSRTQLHRKIKGEAGVSTTQYMNKIKLHEAKSLLNTTDLSISEIAYRCSFNHPSYFSQLFLQQYKCTPGEYRKSTDIVQQ